MSELLNAALDRLKVCGPTQIFLSTPFADAVVVAAAEDEVLTLGGIIQN
jgi:hypothetical protein